MRPAFAAFGTTAGLFSDCCGQSHLDGARVALALHQPARLWLRLFHPGREPGGCGLCFPSLRALHSGCAEVHVAAACCWVGGGRVLGERELGCWLLARRSADQRQIAEGEQASSTTSCQWCRCSRETSGLGTRGRCVQERRRPCGGAGFFWARTDFRASELLGVCSRGVVVVGVSRPKTFLLEFPYLFKWASVQFCRSKDQGGSQAGVPERQMAGPNPQKGPNNIQELL